MRFWIWIGLMIACMLFATTVGTALAADTIIEWDGGCYDSQVYGLGAVTLVKSPDEGGFDVTMIGQFVIYSPTYGYTRHELPPGFLPDTFDRADYQCQEAVNDGAQRVVSIAQGNETTDLQYENGSIWFPDKFHNGAYSLTCRWKTDQPDPAPGVWESCASITIKSATSTPVPTVLATPEATPTATATPTFVPTAPAPSVTSVTPIPNVIPTVLVTPQPEQRKLFIPQAHANLCLPGSCN